jgi:IS30 family transposase
MVQFSERMVPEVVQVFWAAIQRGEFITDAAAEVGTYRVRGARWLRAKSGVRPRRGRDLKGRCLTFAEREQIALARAGGESMRAIARRLGRSPSTISRELSRNTGRAGCYRATTAHARVSPREPTQAGQARDEPRAAPEGGGRSQAALLTGADRRPVAPPVP